MKITILFIVVLTKLIYITKACDEEDNQLDPYYPYEAFNPFQNPFWYYRSPSSLSVDYEGRSRTSKPQFLNPFNKMSFSKKANDPDSRVLFGKLGLGASLLNAGFFNNRFGNNMASSGGSRPSNNNNQMPIIRNPDFSISTFETCTSFSQEDGICVPGAACSLFGGRPSGSCGRAGVCCINAVTRCSSTITLNNTYWQSPVTGSSSCSLTLRLDEGLFEQPRAISQVRLDFIAFSISQPNAESVCATDIFRVTGATNRVPEICGDNSGQHMYLNVLRSATNEINLSFNFGALSTVSRNWNIKISLLPSGANYLAPAECLQYFTSSSGTVSSFNWRDVAGASTRQLANQDYNICFRTELINNQNVQLHQRANTLCFSSCSVITGQLPFSLSVPYKAATVDPATNVVIPGAAAPGFSQIVPGNCNNDYLIIPGGFDPATINQVGVVPNVLDRFCGDRFNCAIGSQLSSTVCTTASPFRILYRTNVDETLTVTHDIPGTGNRGFCLNFQEKLV